MFYRHVTCLYKEMTFAASWKFDIMDRSYGSKSFPFRTDPCKERIDK